MPPMLFLALAGAAGIAGYRLWSRLVESAQISRREGAGRMRPATAPVRDLGNLEWDEGAGVYRPRANRDN